MKYKRRARRVGIKKALQSKSHTHPYMMSRMDRNREAQQKANIFACMMVLVAHLLKKNSLKLRGSSNASISISKKWTEFRFALPRRTLNAFSRYRINLAAVLPRTFGCKLIRATIKLVSIMWKEGKYTTRRRRKLNVFCALMVQRWVKVEFSIARAQTITSIVCPLF